MEFSDLPLTLSQEIEMYITNEDYEYHDRLFNSLDNSTAQDFMDLLMRKCSQMTGEDEWIITIRSAEEIAAKGIPQNHIITRQMIDEAHQAALKMIKEEDDE